MDRRIAAHAVRAEKEDHRGLYANDIILDPIIDGEAKTTAVDYIRQAISFSQGSPDMFYSEYLTDLAEVLDYVDLPGDDMDKVTILWKLFQRHGCQVREGIERMRLLNENVFGPVAADSLLGLVSSREYLKPEVERCVQRVEGVIREALGDMFRTTKPKDENDLNLKLGALLRSHESIIASEHPTVSFACASVVPDHTWEGTDLLIEAKYIRGATSPSKASEGIAADLTKYPQEAFVVFVVYDPEHAIKSDGRFERDIQGRGRNRVLIIR